MKSIVFLLIVFISCKESSKPEPQKTVYVNTDSIKDVGRIEERLIWEKWKSSCIQKALKITKTAEPKVIANSGNCCQQAKIIANEAMDILELLNTKP